LLFKETLMPVAAPGVADRFSSSPGRDWHRAPLIRARSRFMDWSNWQKHDRALAQRRIKWLTVETRAQALDAAISGAGVTLIDMAYIATPVAEGRLRKLAEHPLPLPTGYYFVSVPKARNLHLLQHLRDWAIEAAEPFRMVY
jgi:DNA-binding transcriptional LysR family regulator